MAPSTRKGDLREWFLSSHPERTKEVYHLRMRDGPDFVGREAILQELSTRLDQALHGRPSITVLSGEAGIGKTRLVAELMTMTQDVVQLQGTCFSYTSCDLPFSPFVQAFRPVASGAHVAALAKSDLAALAPVLPLASAPRHEDRSRWQQVRLFELTLRLVGDLAADTGLLLVLDDLHWTDQATLDLLCFLGANVTHEKVMIVASMRSDEPGTPAWLGQGLDRLNRLPNTFPVSLGPLSDGESRELWSQVRRDVDPTAGMAAEALERASGIPFFIEELAHSVDTERAVGPQRSDELIRVRVEGMADSSRTVLQLLAVAGAPVHHRVVERVVSEDCSTALKELVGIRAVVSDGPASFRVRHALLSEAIHAGMLPSERVRFHEMLADAAEHDPAAFGGRDEAAAATSRHWLLADRPDRALAPLIGAGDAAEARHGSGDAARLFKDALGAWERVVDPVHRAGISHASLLAKWARSVRWGEDAREGVAALERAVAEAESAEERVTILEQMARHCFQLGLAGRSLEAASAACREADLCSPPIAAKAHATLGMTYAMRADYEASLAHCERSLELCGETFSPERAYALSLAGVAMSNLGRDEDALPCLSGAVTIAERVDDPEGIIRNYINLSYIHENAGRWIQAADAASAGLEVATAHGLEHTAGVWLASNKASALKAMGNWSDAERTLVSALARRVPAAVERYLQLLLAEIDIGKGRFAVALERITNAMVDEEMIDAIIRGQLYLDRVRLDLARNDLDQAIQDAHTGLLGEDLVVEPIIGLRLAALGLRAMASNVERGRISAANSASMLAPLDAFLAEAESLAAQTADLQPCQDELALCRLEHARGRFPSESSAWRELGDRFEHHQQPYSAAYAFSMAAQMLVGEGDRLGAGRLVQQAGALLAQMEEVPTMRVLAGLANACHVRLEVTETNAESVLLPPQDSLGLTPRERQVLARLAQGDSNRHIARALFITEKTASVHVSNILSKLNVRNRAGATAIAHRLGLVEAGHLSM